MSFEEDRKKIEATRIMSMYYTATENILKKTKEELDEDLCIEGAFVLQHLMAGRDDKEVKQRLSILNENHRNARMKDKKNENN